MCVKLTSQEFAKMKKIVCHSVLVMKNTLMSKVGNVGCRLAGSDIRLEVLKALIQ